MIFAPDVDGDGVIGNQASQPECQYGERFVHAQRIPERLRELEQCLAFFTRSSNGFTRRSNGLTGDGGLRTSDWRLRRPDLFARHILQLRMPPPQHIDDDWIEALARPFFDFRYRLVKRQRAPVLPV